MSEHSSWAAAEGERLADGWEPGASDTLLRAYVDGFADMTADVATCMDGRVERDDTIVLADAGSPAPYLNGAILLRPLGADEVDEVVRRAQQFFAAGSGGPWLLFSPLPLPHLGHLGLAPIGHPPFMVRGPGGARREAPADLEVITLDDEATLGVMEAALRDFYPMPELIGQPAGSILRASLLEKPEYCLYLGRVNGEPVGTAMAHRHGDVAHVEWITSDPARRGRGYGEAMTWEATLAWPDLPATLIASDAGRPTYERMGYLTVLRITLWSGTRA